MGYSEDLYDYYDFEKPREILEIEQKFDNCREFFIDIYQQLCSTEKLDLALLYNHLSEISGYLDVDDSQFGDLTISRESKIIQFAGV